MTTPNSLQNKVCLVTGGARGIGLAIARMLLEEGASVAICSRNERSVQQAVHAFQAEGLSKVKGKAADVSDSEQVHALFEFVDRELGPLDVLVNNAGIGMFAKVSELDSGQWAEMLGTNLTGMFYCSREALFRFQKRSGKESRGGNIIQIGSLAGKNAFAGGTAYNASKFGVNGFSEALLLDVRHDNVRVCTIAPGSVATAFGGSPENDGEDWKIWPEDVAGMVRAVLCLPARSMVSYVEIRPSRPKRKT